MNEDRHQGPGLKPQARQKHSGVWQEDLNPDHLAGQNTGLASEATQTSERTAFHLRKRGHEVRGLDDNDLKQVPVLAEGTRLQQGATYLNLADEPPYEFRATGNVTAEPGDAYVPKDRVPYEVWNRLLGRRRV